MLRTRYIRNTITTRRAALCFMCSYCGKNSGHMYMDIITRSCSYDLNIMRRIYNGIECTKKVVIVKIKYRGRAMVGWL